MKKSHNFDLHRIPGWMKLTPLMVSLMVVTPTFAETSISEGGVAGTLSAPASVELLSTTRVVSDQEQEGEGFTTFPEIVQGSTSASSDLSDEEPIQATEVSVSISTSEILEALDSHDRENAQIVLETADRNEAVINAESLWNSGSFDMAIDQIRSIEASGGDLVPGISWKTPKTVISPNWSDSDSQIGTRTNIEDSKLDFDAGNGNLFTVLKTSTTWTVNISTDGGKTWRETYSWGASVTDISAVVARGYLWVSYVYTADDKEVRMRRANVNDGSIDFTYDYKVIFEKDRAIKEVTLFSGTDTNLGQLFLSTILEDYTSVLDTLVSSQATVVNSESEVEYVAPITMGTTQQIVSQLETHPKVRHTKETLKSLNSGETTTRVIVNLVNPDAGMLTTNAVSNDFSDANVRDDITQQVSTVQNHVINLIDKTQMNVTNRFKYIYGFSAEVTAEGLAALVNDPDVLSIEPDVILEPHGAQAIPQMNATTARSSYTGSGMSIAICDTGVDYTHPMLGGAAFPNTKVIGGYDTGDDDADPMDEQGHGTSVAGIAAGTLGTNGDYIGGVAHDAKIYALKMSRADNSHRAYNSDMIEAWEWVITHQNDNPSYPIRIVNTSFGGGYYTDEATCDAYSVAMATAAANAKAVGITHFVSTGNDGLCDGTGWPGCISDVVGVGAVYDANIGNKSWCVSEDSCLPKTPTAGCSTGFVSNSESTALDQVTAYSNTASFMEIFAPSNDATTPALGGGYTTTFGGTSAASPYAAGAGAILQSAHFAKTGSYLTPDQLQAAMIDSGDPITDAKAAITKPRVNVGNINAAIDNLTYHWAHTIDTTPIWTEIPTSVGNAWSGLDGTYKNASNTNAWYGYLSYIAANGTDKPVMVTRRAAGLWEHIQVASDYTGYTNTTAISAYGDTVMTVYEHDFGSSDYGIYYRVSYDGGDSWTWGIFEAPAGEDFFNPDVTARGGYGIGIVYSHASTFDSVIYQEREGYPYTPWKSQQINEHDVRTGFPNAIEELPSSDTVNNHGIVYLDNSSTAHFDKAVEEKNTDITPIILYLLN